MIDEVLGRVTAYADAVAAGYTGTREQFSYDLAHAADYASTAGAAAENASESEENAKDSEEAAAQSEGNAEGYAQSAHDDAAAALEAKGQAIAAKNDAVTAKGLAENSATIANSAKIAAAQSEQNAYQFAESAEQDAGDASNSASSASTSSLKSEGFAVGEQNGVPVESGSPYYENNSKYYSEQAAAQLGLVTAEGTRQIGLVTDEGTAQKAAVQEKGEQTLASIPEDYTTLRNDVSSLKSDLGVFKHQFSGEYDNNLLFGAIWTFGKYIDADGSTKTNVDYAHTNMIEVDPSTLYHAIDCGGFFFNWYDETETRISGNSTNAIQITSPANAKYLVISLYKTRWDISKIYKESEYVVYGKEAYEAVAGLTADVTELQNITPKTFYIGTGQTYTTLREGIAEAVKYLNSKVYVLPGTYDLVTEFADAISSNMGTTGVALKNNVHIIFCDGAKVTALFNNDNNQYDATTWRRIYDHFNPFHFAWTNANSLDFTLENLDIECANTRYCVHDDYGQAAHYLHKYINCRMKYTNNHSDIAYVQCIGGGFGIHGTIVIDGGHYESATDYGLPSVGGSAEDSQQPISYHNSGFSENAESSVTVNNVYLANRGYFRFGWYGPSSLKSQVQISGCSTGLPTLVKAEGTAMVNNFEVTEFCNEKRNAEHWVVSEDGRTASLVND